MLVGLLDFVERNGKSRGSKSTPLVLHLQWRLRKRAVETAKSEGITVNAWFNNVITKVLAQNEAAQASDTKAA